MTHTRHYYKKMTEFNKKTVLVVFGKNFPTRHISKGKFNTIVADKIFQKNIETLSCEFIDLETLTDPGSVHEASDFLEELSHLTLPNGSRLVKSFIYKGYELWWIHYGDLFRYFCFPYTQYKKLLEYLKNFQNVYFYKPAYKSLFSCYLQTHRSKVVILHESGLKSPSALPLGVFLQIVVTLISIPILMLRKRRILAFTGDKFEKDCDYDSRMKFIYEELRRKNIPFIKFIRSLESWKIVLRQVLVRKRPVIYSEGMVFVSRFFGIFSGRHRRAKQKIGAHVFASETDITKRFKLLIATQYLLTVHDDVWAIRIMKWILRLIGVKAAFITSASGRNFHTVLGCKLNGIPTVGILHGVASRYYSVYDFSPGFDGDKSLSVDEYGLWSKWWEEYYIKYSQAYKPDQLYISGPMRPLQSFEEKNISIRGEGAPTRVLFVAEQTVSPSESMPYLHKLLNQKDIELTIKFRPYRDGFEDWLIQNEPQILKMPHIRIVKRGMQEAIQNVDVVIGCHSTGVLEALLQLKIPIFIRSQKWGDYYSMTESSKTQRFFAENPYELIERIKQIRTISQELLMELRERYFGDPHKNGSAWVVNRLEQLLE